MVALGWTIGVSLIIKPYTTKAKSIDGDRADDETTLLPEERNLVTKK
jgi:undecaprenyl-diphosphatase